MTNLKNKSTTYLKALYQIKIKKVFYKSVWSNYRNVGKGRFTKIQKICNHFSAFHLKGGVGRGVVATVKIFGVNYSALKGF